MTSREYWDRRAHAWGKRMDAHKAKPDMYGAAAMDALEVQRGEAIVDIGCGQGQTSLELARRVGSSGHVLGLDIAPAMIAGAIRRLDAEFGPGEETSPSVEFRVDDMQTVTFTQPFDAAFSRFGVMFFPDPAAAFANIAAAIRPGGRLACVVWGPIKENPWATVPTIAAAEVLELETTKVESDGPGPFSLGDPRALEEHLVAAGFRDVAFEDLTYPRRFMELSALEELGTWLTIGTIGDTYSAADPELQVRATEAALAAIEPYRVSDDEGGWSLPALARVVTAARP